MCRLLDEVDALHRDHVPWLFTTPSTAPRSAESFADFLIGDRAVAFVADVDHVIGVALGLLRSTPDFPVFRREEYAVIDAIAVAPAWRRRGTGTRLVHAVEAWATTKGARWVELNVYHSNQDALAFYEKLGFASYSSKLRKVPSAG